MGISDNLSDSFSYATDGLVGKWTKWILLIIGSIIFPITMGYTIRVMKGVSPAPDADNIVGLFVDGVKMFVIGLVYQIIPLIIGAIVLVLSGGSGLLTMAGMNVTDPWAFFGLIVGSFAVAFIIWFVISIIFSLFQIIGMVRFARTGSMGEAFAFSEITAKIGSIGWISFIIALLVLIIVVFIIYMILMMIPVIGWLLALIIAPLISIMSARYQSNLYDSAG